MSDQQHNSFTQENIISYFKKNKKSLIIVSVLFIVIGFSFIFYQKNIDNKNTLISNKFNKASILIDQNNIGESKILLKEIIINGHKFYSPLALYLLIEKKIEKDNDKIIFYFDEILKINSLDKENVNLIKIKKTFFLFKTGKEEDIIKNLNPIINSNSVWKKTAIDLLREYYIHKGENLKADQYKKLLDITKTGK
jgi:predicted negative regulator of RcsB-dependent stress response